MILGALNPPSEAFVTELSLLLPCNSSAEEKVRRCVQTWYPSPLSSLSSPCPHSVGSSKALLECARDSCGCICCVTDTIRAAQTPESAVLAVVMGVGQPIQPILGLSPGLVESGGYLWSIRRDGVGDMAACV